jgi:UDP-sugar transporter A1/2/3
MVNRELSEWNRTVSLNATKPTTFLSLLTIRSGLHFLLVPALLYTFQNVLQYRAMELLDAAVFQVTSQLKLLTTAFFSTIFLNMQLGLKKWLSLVILAVGVALVQLPSSRGAHSEASTSYAGLLMVIISCTLSGISGVYFEMIVKGKISNDNSFSQESLWARNFQLATVSVPLAVIVGLAGDRESSTWLERPFFEGFSHWSVWATIILNATGGLLVSVVVKYSDNVMKGFATSLAILASAVLSVIFLNWNLTENFLIGASLVLAAVYMYTTKSP